MNLSDYQQAAAATAQPAAYSHDYLVPMIVGETGELFGQRAKAQWHGWTPEKLQQALVLELGDIAWGTAILLKTLGVESVHSIALRPSHTLHGVELDPWQKLLNLASSVHLFHASEETKRFVPTEAARLWRTMELYSLAITGSDFDTVLLANLNKLASRAARGVLQGAGDYR